MRVPDPPPAPPMREPKKLAMLPPVRCTEEYVAQVARCAAAEDRKASAFIRRAVTYYMLQFHPGIVAVEEGEVTGFGALLGDASDGRGD